MLITACVYILNCVGYYSKTFVPVAEAALL